MKPRALALALLLTCIATQAAAQEWAEHYLAARDRHIPDGRYAEALRELDIAVRLKPHSALNEQTYGLDFVDYVPYYHIGLCQLRLGDAKTAVQSFEKEEQQKAIRGRPALLRLLQTHRQEAQAEVARAEQQRLTRLAQYKVDDLLTRSADFERERRFDQALELLSQAQQAAEALDAQTQRRVQDRLARVRASKHEAEETEARLRRIEKALSDARRMLDEGREQNALVKYDEVLSLDPKNAQAEAGKTEAQQRILAATTRQERERAFQQGRMLFDAGQYAEALPFLQKAAADAGNTLAQDYLTRANERAEALRRQRETRRRIERLMAEGEKLLASGQYAAAQVKFQDVLELDPADPRAKERQTYAEERSQEALFEKRSPNQPPVLSIFEPVEEALETEMQTVSVKGIATDDRGLARLEFFVSGRLEEAQTVPPRIDSGKAQREFPIRREFTLAPGVTEIRIRATDVLGVTRETTFRVSRQLRFYERRSFLLSALATAVGLLGVAIASQRIKRARAVQRRFNPYIAGAPVTDESLFFGRQRLLSRVLNLLHHNSFMITGERRIGKTSFLLRLLRALESDQSSVYRFYPVFVDLSGVPEEGFFQAIMSDVVDALSLAPETQAALRFAPGRERYEGRDFSHDMQRILGELQALTERRVKLILLVDEVDVLNQYSERTNQLLRSIFMKTFAEHLATVMCGVGLKRAWTSDGSPWYNFFELIQLTPFSREDAEALIRTPVAGIFRYDSQAVELILEYSEMKPYLVQKFCIQAVNRILDDNRKTVTALDIQAVKDSVLAEWETATPSAVPDDARRVSA